MWAHLGFKGANEEFEIESYEEFVEKLPKAPVKDGKKSLEGWIFQSVNLSTMEANVFAQLDWSGSLVLGCEYPPWTSADEIRRRGGHVLENDTSLPFQQFRNSLYCQDELAQMDSKTFQWYLNNREKLRAELSMTVHDCCVRDALYDFLEGRRIVAIMGGHALQRNSAAYHAVVRMAWRLAQEGFIVATGGGPGAMEAGNLGAYLHDRSEGEVLEVCQLLSCEPERRFDDPCPVVDTILERFGSTDGHPSLGFPTYFYGHEPSNRFAAWHAKMFSNALREDGLIQIANCGIVFCPGSAGTRQEIFQLACLNHYSADNSVSPMVFFNVDGFWNNPECDIYDMVCKCAKGRPYAKLLHISDDVDDIVDHFVTYKNGRIRSSSVSSTEIESSK